MIYEKVKSKKPIKFHILILCFLILTSSVFTLKADDNTKIQIANGVSLSIFSVKGDGEIGHPECYNYYGKCIILGSKIPLIVLNKFDYTILDEKKPGFIVHLDTKSQQLLNKVSMELIGKRMVIAFNRNILHIGKVKSIINTNKLQLTFCNKRNFNTILTVFSSGEVSNMNNLDCNCD